MNIAEILKNVPKGTKLYSPVLGDVNFKGINNLYIEVLDLGNIVREFYHDGRFYMNGECMLFPSRENRDWSKFTLNKFDIKSLKPFDKVLIRNDDNDYWRADLYSHRIKSYRKFVTVGFHYPQCIPYNDETKHLVGTDKDCPEYYKTW